MASCKRCTAGGCSKMFAILSINGIMRESSFALIRVEKIVDQRVSSQLLKRWNIYFKTTFLRLKNTKK